LKSVSLVTAPSSSGESEPPNRARQWIALIGTLAFGAGVMSQSWHVAIIGIVFSSLVAVAMWQGLRARLPYLFDVWSEQRVPAPSLLHATVSIALLSECIGLVTGIAFAAGGPSGLWVARALSYGLVGGLACLVMQSFLAGRDVSLRDIIRWSGDAPGISLPAGLLLGAGVGAGLALLAAGYMALLEQLPMTQELVRESARLAAGYDKQMFWVALLAVGFAPVAEEYFFRGLLFRTLDRELGDWRALVLSAAFFAVFHPPLAWVPVACLGACAAWLFKSTRHLLPCVVCHMVYNAGVLWLG
jgi:membrane protease YdiL (CAAX protease family)